MIWKAVRRGFGIDGMHVTGLFGQARGWSCLVEGRMGWLEPCDRGVRLVVFAMLVRFVDQDITSEKYVSSLATFFSMRNGKLT